MLTLMFTGIVTEVGTVREIRRGAASAALTIEMPGLASDVAVGDSVAVNGACLTVTSIEGESADFDVVTETLGKTTLGEVSRGDRVNLEGALRVGDRLSGHFVMGHVDGVGVIVSRTEDPGQVTMRVRAPESVAGYLLEKGSITVHGVSLTLWDVKEREFSVALVPHTLGETNLTGLRAGSKVNLEADVLARWVAKLFPRPADQGITLDTLRRAGYDVDQG
jgi:riboflavin synthase